MSNDALSTAKYAAAIEEMLKARDELDRGISLLRRLMATTVVAAPPSSKPKPPKEVASMMPGDACVWMLREKAVPMTNREILDALAAIGYKKIKATDNVNSALRHRKANKGDVARDGTHWSYLALAAAEAAATETHLNGAAASESAAA